MGKINIGAFTDRITFLKAVNSKGQIAQLHKQYVVLTSVFANVQVLPTSESVVDGNLIALEKIHVETYTLSGINTNCIIRWGSYDYNISSVVYDRARPFMELDAIKMLNDER
ncbi:hypothetical protein [Butyricimonas faecihominis]|jgi:head-tail adaptor|nr:MAG TPA: putative head-tail adaptor [Caudoviricetes sp.]